MDEFKIIIDGKNVEFKVLKPTTKQHREGKLVFNAALAQSLQSNALLRQSIDKHMRKQGLWDDTKQKEYDDIYKDIHDCERKISKGGIKLSEAKDLALKIRQGRASLQLLLIEKNQLDQHSAEGQAQQEEFNKLLSLCLVYKEGEKQYFSSVEELDKDSNSDIVQMGSTHLMEILYGSNEDYYNKLPENEFLKKWGFVNDDLRLINKEGKLINAEGKLINEDGQFIDGEGKLIDKDGNPLDDEGNYNFETQPFLDDDGNPIEEKKEEKDKKEEEEEEKKEKEEKEEKEKPKVKRKVTKKE